MRLNNRIRKLEEAYPPQSGSHTVELVDGEPGQPSKRSERVDEQGNRTTTITIPGGVDNAEDGFLSAIELPEGPFKLITGTNPIDMV